MSALHMPEVPHLNSNLQRFVGNDSQSTTPRVHREEITRSLEFPDPRNPPDHSLSLGPSSPRYPYNQLPSKDISSDQSEGSSVTGLMYSSTSANLHQMITNAKKLHSTYIRDKSKDSNLTLPTILN
ncbi:uncharacterized protein LOC131949270 [Physella acuta]|uniref:uncharacterized protein LOC131949270 n=1 Tax=Physella acuta TaxID=109671 RepID=UPI0027DE721F|nr:uncharacterized protein LOC131949270 [Physella acuta]